MIKELIFSGKKYFEGTMPSYFGKTVKKPSSGCKPYVYDSFWDQPDEDWSLVYPEGKIIGEATTTDGKYLLTRTSSYWISLTELLQNGGVSSSPLTHLYQGLRSLFKEVVACL